MKESVGSMSLFLILVALWNGYSSITGMLASPQQPIIIAHGIILFFAVSFLFVGARLQTLLVRNPGIIKLILGGSLVGMAIWLVLSLQGIAPLALIPNIVWVIVTLYLMANVSRLSREEQAKVAASRPASRPSGS
jgi:tryptophan-rich sensory protein